MSSSSLPSPTQKQERGGLPLRRLLVGLALLTLVATAEKVVGLSAPMPTAEVPSSLALAGYRISTLPAAGPRRGREMSHGTMRHFRLVPLSGEPELTLSLLPVRSRTGTDLSAETLGGKGLSMEAMGSEIPGFALKDQRIVSLPVAKAVGAAWVSTVGPVDTLLPTGMDLGAVTRDKLLARVQKVGIVSMAAPLGMAG